METTVRKGERVRSSTSARQNEKIEAKTLSHIEGFSVQDEYLIQQRIDELDRTWDIERTLEINAAVLGLTGTLLGAFVDRRWLILPAVVTTFLVQHAVQGWCPPLPLFRKMGIRTRPEIDREKYALKALRGDFRRSTTPAAAWRAVNKNVDTESEG